MVETAGDAEASRQKEEASKVRTRKPESDK
jgi:hypothetical protein